MKPTCRECGSPLLESDTHCFRCGAPVLDLETSPPAEAQVQVDLRMATLYGGVVVALLIIGAMLMNWMGAGSSNPLAATATPTTPAGWYEYISPQSDFRIWLPGTWRFYMPTSPQWDELARQVSHPLPDGLKREGPRDPGKRLTMLATSPTGDGEWPAEVSVAVFSESANISLGVLQTDSWWAGERWVDTTGAMNISTRDSGESMLVADLIYPAGDGRYTQSVTMILKTERGAYVVTVSALDTDFWQAEEMFWMILDSFQPLAP